MKCNRTFFILAAGLTCQALSVAQTQPQATSFQPAGAMAAGRGGRGPILQLPRTETGRPFSATVTTQTTQTYMDGTHVSQTATMVEYRDAEGRVRTETSDSSSGSAKSIMIRDPVGGVTYRLDPARKAAMKQTATAPGGRGGRSGGAAPDAAAQALLSTQILAEYTQAMQGAMESAQAGRTDPNRIVEDLGMQTLNGVPSRGTRTTTIVPAGAIGNDREFRSVDERWFSSELNMLIKSVSTDPRFGTTTYEMTNISRQSPDPTLFQVPADYTITGN